MKVVERIADSLIIEQVHIGDNQFGFTKCGVVLQLMLLL